MSFQEKIKKYDKLSYGLVLGLILIVTGFVISYFVKTSGLDIPFKDYFFNNLLKSDNKMDIVIFSMIPNMLLFYFVNFRWAMYEFTKGIVGITLLMAIVVIIIGI